MKKILLLLFLLFIFTPIANASYFSAAYTATNKQQLTAGGDLTYYVMCKTGYILHTLENQWVDAISGSANINLYLDSVLVDSRTGLTTSGSGTSIDWDLGDYECTSDTPVTLVFDNTNSTTYQLRVGGFNTGEETISEPLDIVDYTTPTTGMQRLVGSLNYTAPSNSPEQIVTYVPVNQYVTSLECVNATTTTCTFDYSTTTATSTYDYRTNLDILTLFVGLFLFMAIVLFVRLIVKRFL
jgi:hypothetical protein